MTKVRNIILISLLPVAIVLALGVAYHFRSGSDITAEAIKGASCAPEIALPGDTPERMITRAVDRLRDGGKIFPSSSIGNYGDAARIFVRQQPDGIMQVATHLTLCATQTEIVSVNGELVS